MSGLKVKSQRSSSSTCFVQDVWSEDEIAAKFFLDVLEILVRLKNVTNEGYISSWEVFEFAVVDSHAFLSPHKLPSSERTL